MSREPNPFCFGRGAGNVPGCNCRGIFVRHILRLVEAATSAAEKDRLIKEAMKAQVKDGNGLSDS